MIARARLKTSTGAVAVNALNPAPKFQKQVLAAAIALGIASLSPLPAWAQVVSGQVTDQNQKVVFVAARVTLQQDGRAAYATNTDDRGQFRFPDVKAGEYLLEVSYVGAQSTSQPITVGTGDLVIGNVLLNAAGSANSASLEEILVYGQSAAMAGAINQQRAADNLKAVIDADGMGQFPDQNVAEALRRISGVSVENDQGEGRYVVIRGMDPDLNSTSINGVNATSAENRRALQLDVIPSDVLDGLEVQKTLTPDMDGDSIGGSINVKTLSAFSRKEPFVKVRAEGSYNEQAEEWSPKMSVAAADTYVLANDRRLGIAGAVSWNERKFSVDNNEGDDWSVADNGSEFMEYFEPRYYTLERKRSSAVLNLDYDLTDNTAIFLRTLYSEFEDTEVRYATEYGDLELLGDDTVSATLAEYGVAEIARTTKDRKQTATNMSLSGGSDTQAGLWQFKSNVGYNYGEEDDPNVLESVWKSEYESGSDGIPDGAPVLGLNTSNNKKPVLESSYSSLLQDPSRYELDEIEHQKSRVEDTQWSFRLDAIREVDFGELQFGAKASVREKKNSKNVDVYSGDDVWTVADIEDPNGASDYSFPNPIDPVPSLSGIHSIVKSGEGIEFEPIDSEIGSNSNDWKVDEDIYAAYGMFKYVTDNMVVTSGVRVEYTDFSSDGNKVELFEEGDELGGVEVDDDTVVITPISDSRNYTDVLPSINVRYNFSENLLGRAAVSRSVVRPLFEQVASRVNVEDGEADVGNPNLDPYSSWNYDLSLEYYPGELSVISVGVFYKDIQDLIFVQTFEETEFQNTFYDEVTIALNGDEATVLGVEFNYQQFFGFLPSPFDGLLVSANYAYIDGEAKIDGRDISMPKQSDSLAGFTLGYEKYGLELRLAMKYRDRYLDEVVEQGADRYTDSHTALDFSAKYHLNDNWMIYAEVANLGDEPEYYYSGNKSRLYQYDEFGITSTIGFQVTY